MGLRILVTRPEPGAGQTGNRLAVAGFDPVLLPLSKIEPVNDLIFPVDGNVDAVAMTSANAIRYLPDEQLRSIASLPVFAVGPSTANEARRSGMQVEWTGKGNAESLAREMAGWSKPGQNILYLAGRVRRPDFERLLAASDVPVDVVETYDTKLVSYTTKNLIDLLSHSPVAAVLVYSVIAAEQISRLLDEPELSHLLESALFLCLSRRIGLALKEVSEARLVVTETPTEDAVLEILNSGNFTRS